MNCKKTVTTSRHPVLRVFSILLAISILYTFVFGNQYIAFADGIPLTDEIKMNNDIDISGTSSLGNLIANGLSAKNSEQQENNGYNVFSVEVEDTLASVSFETLKDCSLVIGIYDNEGESMLAIGTAEVIAEETEAYVEIDIDSMPEYFYIRAYLVDSDTLRPLCTEYSSPMYTRSMQEFLSKTVNDFESDRVMNFDDNEDTNFAVFSDDTKLIPMVENVNEVISANSETQEYVFANVDESITSLEAGDIFAYEYDGEVLIVKVGSISVDENQATIVGQNTELNEIFDYLRIDGEAPTETAKVDTSKLEDGITYLGCTEDADESEIAPYAVDVEGKKTFSQKFEIKKGDKYESSTTKANYSFSAGLNFSLDASVKVYVSFSEVYFQIKLDYSAKIYAQFEGKVSKSFPLAWLEISPCPGVFIRLTPSFVVEFSGTSKLEGKLTGTIGFKASNKSGSQNLTSKPKFTLEGESQITIFVGFSLEPKLVILHENVADAKLTAKVGAEINTTLVKMSTDPDKGIRHDCDSCIDGDVGVKFSINASVKLFNNGSLTFKVDIFDKTFHLFDFYISLTYGTAGFTECPHISYLENVTVLGKDSVQLQNAKITVDENTTDIYTTDEKGMVEIWIPQGEHKLRFDADGYNPKLSTVKVGKFKRSIKARLTAINEPSVKDSLKDIWDGFMNKIKDGASNPKDVDYNDPNIEEIPMQLRELKVMQVVNGYSANHAAITEDGGLYTWGDENRNGQLGNGTTEKILVPKKILDNVVYVEMLITRSAAITEDGSLYTWGENGGHLGNGTLEDCHTPVKILDDVVSVSLSNEIRGNILDEHNAALTKDGSLYTWGGNRFGQLGNGTEEECYVPQKILDNVSSFCLSEGFSAAVTTDNCLYMWGLNIDNQFGIGATYGSSVPIKVMDNVSSIYISNTAVAAITTNGDLYTWGGSNFYGTLGNGSYDDGCAPTKVLSDVKSFNFYNHDTSAAITKKGELYIWGELAGTAGIIEIEKVNIPTKIMENVYLYNGNGSNNYAITADKQLYTWRWNIQGQLGNGTWENSYTPLKIMNNVESATDFATSAAIIAAITTDGSLYTWGSNRYGHLGDGTTIDSHFPIKIMDNVAQIITGCQTLAITSDGYLYTWGDDRYTVVPKEVCSPHKIDFPKVPVSNQSTHSVNLISSTSNAKKLTNFIPNETYNYYSVNSLAASDMLSADNLLYIGQTISDENGTLTIPDYVPNGEIFAKAMTEFDVYNADITSAEIEKKAVSLTWNSIDGASEYEVISYSENGITTYPKTSDTHITINNLESGDYGFVVTSIVYGEQSVPAINDIVLVHIDTPTKVPTLTVADADGKAKLTWEEIGNVLAYKVYSYENGEYKLLTFTAENSYTAQNLTVGEKYGFIVSACVKDVWSELDENNVVYITMGNHTHNYSTEWKYDDNDHWHECTCGNKTDVAAHSFNDNMLCSVCGASMTKKTVVITFPDSVMVTTTSETFIHSGDEVTTGDKLLIEAIVPDGKKLTSLTVNGEEIENGGRYSVGNTDITIEVKFEDIQTSPADKFTITIPQNVAVTRNDVAINNGAEIQTGDVLRIEVTVPEGKKLDSLTINGSEIKNGSSYTVKNSDVVIKVVFSNVETPPAPTQKYTITIPQNVTVRRNNIVLNNGSEIHEGEKLTITANAPSGYTLSSLTVNGNAFSNGGTYTVGKENVSIAVSFRKISTGGSGSSGGSSGSSRPSYRTITIPENVVVTRNGTELSDGNIIYSYDELRIEANVPAGKKLTSLSVNGIEIKNGDVYTVGTGNVIIAVSFEDISSPTHTIIIPSGVIVTRGSTAVKNGDTVNEGDILTIKADIPEGYKLNSLAVNGKEIHDGGIYTAGKDNMIVTVSFEKIPDNKPNEPFAISDSDKRGWNDISELLSIPSDKTIRIDMNGSTLLPESVLQIIKNNGNKLLLRMDEKISWSIDGKNVEKVDRDVDLKVTLGTNNIPEETIKKLVGELDYLTLTLEHNGDFGFKALLSVNVGEQYNGEKAALHWFNDNEFKSESRCDILYGMAIMEFTHASDWIVVFGEPEDNSNSDNSNSDTSSSGTSNPDATLPGDSQTSDPNKNNSSTSNSNDKSKDKDDEGNPNTGTRISLTAFLALIASAALSLVTRKQKQ